MTDSAGPRGTKEAPITGVTGQDGAYLAELLLDKGREVHGIKRRTSLLNTDGIDPLCQDPHEKERRFKLHHGDITGSTRRIRGIQQAQPDEIHTLAAQRQVAVSFEGPGYTADSDALGPPRVPAAIRIRVLEHRSRYQPASTSELYGRVPETPQSGTTPLYPRSPCAVARLCAQWIRIGCGEAYGLYACKVVFDTERPHGAPRTLPDRSRLRPTGWRPRTALEEGLRLARAGSQDSMAV